MYTTARKIHVENLTSSRSGEAVRNQFSIDFDDHICFQSYESLIAVYSRQSGELVLGYDFDYSRTTSKYLHQWMYENCYRILANLPAGKSFTDQLRKAIDKGLIGYDDNMR